eukprot:1179476-Prorocentrum_minimum.AAC.2
MRFAFPPRALRTAAAAASDALRQTISKAGYRPTSRQMHVEAAVKHAAPKIIEGLNTNGWAVVENFFANSRNISKGGTGNHTIGKVESICAEMRAEAVAFFDSGRFRVSQSTRWLAATEELQHYDKHNVYAMQLHEKDVPLGPCLYAYSRDMAKALVPLINSHLGSSSHLEGKTCRMHMNNENPDVVINKLAVCTGDGSGYDAHLDNTGLVSADGLRDTRKLTVIIYLTSDWEPTHGGQFRVHNPPPGCTSSILVNPVADTLLVFWSDELLHSVMPSQAPGGESDHRYAFTLWLTAGEH